MADYTGNGAIQRGGTLQGVIRHLLEVGWRAVNALANTFGPDTIVPSAVGRHFTF